MNNNKQPTSTKPYRSFNSVGEGHTRYMRRVKGTELPVKLYEGADAAANAARLDQV